jgi:LEA14-like dessication related protein
MLRGIIRHLAGTALLGAGLSGCGSGVFREPVVTLENVQLAGLGLRGGTLTVNVQIQNPNRFALSTDEVEYQIAIADVNSQSDTTWVDLASGTYTEELSVGAGQTATVDVPVEFQYSGLGSAGSALLRAGTFNYRATGAVDLDTPLGSYKVPFERGGMVSLLGGAH